MIAEQIRARLVGQLIYLASPFFDDSECVRVMRAYRARVVATELVQAGLMVFCPIAYTSSLFLSQSDHILLKYSAWRDMSRRLIGVCDVLMVLRLDGWQRSIGVADELRHAHALGKPVFCCSEGQDRILEITPHIVTVGAGYE